MLKHSVITAACLFLLLTAAGCRKDENPASEDDGLPPAVPADPLITYATDGAIICEWRKNSEPDFAGYYVYRSTDSLSFSVRDTVVTNYYIDDTLRYTTRYYYYVKAFDNSGRVSEASTVCAAVPINRYAPARPYNVTAAGINREGRKSIALNWFPSGSNDVAGYNIYRSTTPNFSADSAAFLSFTTGTYWEDTVGLAVLTDYYYRLRAKDRGSLLSTESPAAGSNILPVAPPVFPANNSTTDRFQYFLCQGTGTACRYRVVLQSTPEYGELWQGETEAGAGADTVWIRFNYYPLQGVPYYWRVITYRDEGGQPMSISPVFTFTVR